MIVRLGAIMVIGASGALAGPSRRDQATLAIEASKADTGWSTDTLAAGRSSAAGSVFARSEGTQYAIVDDNARVSMDQEAAVRLPPSPLLSSFWYDDDDSEVEKVVKNKPPKVEPMGYAASPAKGKAAKPRPKSKLMVELVFAVWPQLPESELRVSKIQGRRSGVVAGARRAGSFAVHGAEFLFIKADLGVNARLHDPTRAAVLAATSARLAQEVQQSYGAAPSDVGVLDVTRDADMVEQLVSGDLRCCATAATADGRVKKTLVAEADQHGSGFGGALSKALGRGPRPLRNVSACPAVAFAAPMSPCILGAADPPYATVATHRWSAASCLASPSGPLSHWEAATAFVAVSGCEAPDRSVREILASQRGDKGRSIDDWGLSIDD